MNSPALRQLGRNEGGMRVDQCAGKNGLNACRAAVRPSSETLDVSARSDGVREAHRRSTNHFRSHEHKMTYPPEPPGRMFFAPRRVYSGINTLRRSEHHGDQDR